MSRALFARIDWLLFENPLTADPAAVRDVGGIGRGAPFMMNGDGINDEVAAARHFDKVCWRSIRLTPTTSAPVHRRLLCVDSSGAT